MTEAADSFSLGFIALLVVVFLTKIWLTHRQVRHVMRHRGQVPKAFSDVIDLSAHQKAADYTAAKSRLETFEVAWQMALLLGWTLLGGLNVLNHWLLTWIPPGFGQQLALLLAFGLVSALLDAPLSAYRTFVLEQKFGFNRNTFPQWLTDGLKGTMVALALGVPLAALVLWLMESAGTLWWLWSWGVYMGFSVLMMWVLPTFIAPLFNSFQPLEDASLRERVNALMQRCGFQPSGFFVVDGSRRSAHANAYFTGWGKAKRVVFYDTLLSQLSPPELEAVLAHELGHFHHKHLSKRVSTMAVITLVAFALLGWLSSQAWFYVGLGVEPSTFGPNHAVALLLFMLAAPLLGFVIGPMMAAVSRRDEFQADHFASLHAPAAHLASALTKLYQGNASTLTPDPLYVAFHHSHPPASQRLARLNP